jgi:Transposase DDE domain
VFAGDHLVAPGRLVPRARKEQDKEQDNSCAILEELDRKKDASGGAPQMIESGALFLIGPKWVKSECGWILEVVKRTDDVKGFKLLPRRWVVERTFGWLGRFRRMSKDYEFHPETSESLIHLAMINIMARRLAAA